MSGLLSLNCYSQIASPNGKILSKAQHIGKIAYTKWQRKVADRCINYISFTNDSYEDYNCETDFPYSGKYKIKGDTLYLTEIDLKSNLPGKNRYIVKARSRWVQIDNKLKCVAKEEFFDGKWELQKFKSSKENVYTRVR